MNINFKLNKTMSPESRNQTVLIHQKILVIFKQFEKNFTEKSEPLFLDNMGEKISLKRIYDLESIDDKPISLIAVTRKQYDISNFSRYENYIKNKLNKDGTYYGLWSDGWKVEYDVLYAVPTDNYEQIQNHLNSHDQINCGITQMMALTIHSNGNYKIIENTSSHILKKLNPP